MESDPLRKESLESSVPCREDVLQWEYQQGTTEASGLYGISRRCLPWLLCLSLILNLLMFGATLWTGLVLRTSPSFGNSQGTAKFNVLTNFGEADLRFQSLEEKYDDLWDSNFNTPNTSGILDFPDADHNTGFQKLGGLAMFHQLHCLWIIRVDLRRAIKGQDVAANWANAAHGNHCLDYLRKSIRCFADETIERPTIDDSAQPDSSGNLNLEIRGHERRMCRSAEALYVLREKKMIHQ